MDYSPIVIFAFNRLQPLKACVTSLRANPEAAESNLIVFVDGPRPDKVGEDRKVHAVREYVKTITGFKSLTYHFSEKNKKLGPSIIAGVTEVMRKYGRAIVMEDDLVASRNMLAFVNQGLEKYENMSEVFSISAYTNIVKIPKGYGYDAYFAPRSTSWGWATWRNRWESVDWELTDWTAVESNAKAFNRWGGSDCYGMLRGWHEGRNQSWAIRFCYAQFVQNKQSLFPTVSKIDNEGFDGDGTNCKKWSRFKFILDTSGKPVFTLPDEVITVKSIVRSSLSYHSIPMRIYSRIMYKLTDWNIIKQHSNRDMKKFMQITPPYLRE